MRKFLFYSLYLIFFLTACGQTGPLYLPGAPPPIYVAPDAEQQIEEMEDSEQDPEQELEK